VREFTEIQKRLITKRIAYLKTKSAERTRRTKRRWPSPGLWARAIRDDKVYFLGYLISTNEVNPEKPVHISSVIKDLVLQVAEKKKAGPRPPDGADLIWSSKISELEDPERISGQLQNLDQGVRFFS